MLTTNKFFALFILSSLLLAGCAASGPNYAPVVNAWNQPAATKSGDYRVQKGDTLYSIAWTFGLDYRALAAANNLRPPYQIEPGQILRMTTSPRRETFVAVKRGQGLQQSIRITKRKAQSPRFRRSFSSMPSPRWAWPARGKVIQGFSNTLAGNKGINITGHFGEAIRAASSGVVVYSGDGVRPYGNLIIVKHNNSYLSAYAYVTIYLEEEIRAEAIVRNLANFARFLELAASESGYIVNYSKLSKVIGVAHTTIIEYYQILEDCLVAERIEPLTKSKTRHKLSKTQKYIIFDLGVRRLAAREGKRPPEKYMGHLFEQFVGLELIKQSRLHKERIKIRYWRDPDGPEVDWIVDCPDKLIPIEVKNTNRPQKSDARHLLTFLNEYDEADKAYIVCQAPRKMKLADRIYALPWQEIIEIIPE